MNLYDWSLDLVWSVIGAIVGLAIEKLFDARMTAVVSALLGVLSLLLVIFGSLGLENPSRFAGVMLGCFCGTSVVLLWERFTRSPHIQGPIFVGGFLVSVVLFGVFWLLFAIKAFRYHYGFGPDYALVEPFFFFGYFSLLMILLHGIFLGPIDSHAFKVILLLACAYFVEQVLPLVFLYQLIGLMFISEFSVSWMLLLVPIPLAVLIRFFIVLFFWGSIQVKDKTSSRQRD